MSTRLVGWLLIGSGLAGGVLAVVGWALDWRVAVGGGPSGAPAPEPPQSMSPAEWLAVGLVVSAVIAGIGAVTLRRARRAHLD